MARWRFTQPIYEFSYENVHGEAVFVYRRNRNDTERARENVRLDGHEVGPIYRCTLSNEIPYKDLVIAALNREGWCDATTLISPGRKPGKRVITRIKRYGRNSVGHGSRGRNAQNSRSGGGGEGNEGS